MFKNSVITTLLCCAIPASASDFSFSGFGTVSAVKTNNENVEFIQNNRLPSGSADSWEYDNDTVLGLQAAYTISKKFKVVGQLLSRRNHRNNYEPSLDWGYLNYKHNNKLNFRFGRFISPVFLASDYRNVNYSNVWVRPPIDLYSQATINNIDGADLVYKDFIGDYTYQIQAYLGKYTLPFPNGGELDFHHMAGVNATIEIDSLSLRAGYMNGDHSYFSKDGIAQPTTLWMNVAQGGLGLNLSPLDATCPLAPAPGLKCADLISNFNSALDFSTRHHKAFDLTNLAAVYDDGSFLLQAELMHRKSASSLADAKAAYIISGYRWNSLTPYLGFSASETLTDKIYLQTSAAYQQVIDTVLQANNLVSVGQPYFQNSVTKQNTITAGVRWDFYQGFALKMQVDQVRPLRHDAGPNDGNGFMRKAGPQLSELGKNIVVSTISIDFIF